MTARRDLGDFGERVAAHRLESMGMSVIERNVRIGRIEIDLVARDGDEVVFVEVRTRRGPAGLAAESVSPAKLRRMWESVSIDRGFVLWHSDTVHRLQMWQTLDGEKPGLVVVNPAQLTHPWPRRQFTARFGFDPLEGVAVGAGAPAQAVADGIAERINAASDLPVVVFRFDESGPSVIMLNKAEAAAGDSAR